MGAHAYNCASCGGERCLRDDASDDEFLSSHGEADGACLSQSDHQSSGAAVLVPARAFDSDGAAVELEALDLEPSYRAKYDDFGAFSGAVEATLTDDFSSARIHVGVDRADGEEFDGIVEATVYCRECWDALEAGAPIDLAAMRSAHAARWRSIKAAEKPAATKRQRLTASEPAGGGGDCGGGGSA